MKPEQLGPYLLRQEEGVPKVSRDSLLLAAFATLRRGDRVFDLGCGSGVLALALAGREEGLTLDGCDLQPSCAALARENLRENHLEGQIHLLSVEELPRRLPAGGYDLAAANPPYFQPGRGKAAPGSRGIARTTGGEGLLPWCRAARWLLRNGGRFALCARPEGLAALFQALRENDLEPKRLQPVQSALEKPANLILVEAVAQGKPGLQLLPVHIAR